MKQELTKYERARVLGARSLQIAMNAPLLIKISKDDLEKINFDSLKIAEMELDSGILPISIKKPFPLRTEEKLKRTVKQKVSDEEVENLKSQEEKEIAEEGEIMKLSNPDDEQEVEDSDEEE